MDKKDLVLVILALVTSWLDYCILKASRNYKWSRMLWHSIEGWNKIPSYYSFVEGVTLVNDCLLCRMEYANYDL